MLVIDIIKDGITINGNFTQILEKKNADGNIISKQEKRQTISRKFPIPDDSDYEKANIKQKDDEIIIILPKEYVG